MEKHEFQTFFLPPLYVCLCTYSMPGINVHVLLLFRLYIYTTNSKMCDTRAHLTNVTYLGVQTLEAFEILPHLTVLCLQRFCNKRTRYSNLQVCHSFLVHLVYLATGTIGTSLSAGYYLFKKSCNCKLSRRPDISLSVLLFE